MLPFFFVVRLAQWQWRFPCSRFAGRWLLNRAVPFLNHSVRQHPGRQSQCRVGVHGNRVIKSDGNDDGDVRLFGQRPFGGIGNADDIHSGPARFGGQLHNFRALAAARNQDHRGVFGKGREGQQLGGVREVYGISATMKEHADVQCGVPTAADSRQVDMPRGANRRGRRINGTSPGLISSRQNLDGPLQFLRLPQYVLQKMGHEELVFRLRIPCEPRRDRIESDFVVAPRPASLYLTFIAAPIRSRNSLGFHRTSPYATRVPLMDASCPRA